MRAVLVDTGPLVALFDAGDSLHPRAVREARRLKSPALVGAPVLTEALHFLRAAVIRKRLQAAFEQGSLQLAAPSEPAHAREALAWLERFADHSPDFADAHLVVWAAGDPKLAVWTFDSEFSTLWRTPAGGRVRLFAGQA